MQGNRIEPFIFQGTAYLPLRAIAEAFGKDVGWDGNTATITINTPAETVPPPREMPTLTAFELQGGAGVRQNQLFRMYGAEYAKGVSYSNQTGNLTIMLASGEVRIGGVAIYNLEGQYRTVSGILGRIDGSGRQDGGVLNIYLDNRLVAEHPLTADMPPTNVSVNVTGVTIMRIEFDMGPVGSRPANFGFGFTHVE